MKCLTLTQPWATLVALGAKRIETRSWSTNYRGPLAIHAAKGWTKADEALCHQPPFTLPLLRAGFSDTRELPRGQVVCVTELIDCISTNLEPIPLAYHARVLEAPDEFKFGDFGANRYLWLLGPPQVEGFPVDARGAQGLWEWNR